MAQMKSFTMFCAALVFGGCSISQQVDPVPRLETRNICIIENPDVREGFLQVYRSALDSKGFQTKMLKESALPDDCPVTSKYTANWRWDLLLYLAFADITVYANGSKVGRALYDSLAGGGNFAKFINAENKIRELVDLLFPYSAPAERADVGAAD
jgi:hypothetical protein